MLAEEQVPLTESDVFTGEPGLSAPVYESDYAHRKPRCDVLLNGSAYAPKGSRRTVSRSHSGRFDGEVVRCRRESRLEGGVLLVSATDPEPFTVMPISYDNAFGGVDRSQKDPLKHHWYPPNHAVWATDEYLDPDSSTASRCPIPRRPARGSSFLEANTGRWRSAP